jgi:hypothetical protein
MILNRTEIAYFKETRSSKPSYNPSISLNYERIFKNKLAFQTGFGFLIMTQNTNAFKNNFYYAVVPIYFKSKVKSDVKKISFASSFGINVNFLTKAQHMLYDKTKSDISEYCETVQIEVVVGLGFNLKLSDDIRLETLLRVSQGSQINKIYPSNLGMQNFNIGLSCSLFYNFKKLQNE